MSKFDYLFNQVINEAGVIDKLRSMNYRRLANRSYKKSKDARDKSFDYEVRDPKFQELDQEFKKEAAKMSQRDKKSKELKK